MNTSLYIKPKKFDEKSDGMLKYSFLTKVAQNIVILCFIQNGNAKFDRSLLYNKTIISLN